MGSAQAETGVLVLHVADPQTRAIPNVTLSVKGDGSAGAPTDRSGRTRIRLAPQTRPGAWVSLQLVRTPRDLVFISPWDGRVRVPPFENESENFGPVVLAARGERSVLENSRALASIAAKVNAARAPNPKESPRPSALADVAREFGLDPADLDRALRGLAAKSKDPYERGMSDLYRLEPSEAAPKLADALQTRERQLKRVAANIVNAAFFLGQALYEQNKFNEAADAYRKALALRPDDPNILNGLGMSLVKAGKPEAAEQHLRKALEIAQAQSNS